MFNVQISFRTLGVLVRPVTQFISYTESPVSLFYPKDCWSPPKHKTGLVALYRRNMGYLHFAHRVCGENLSADTLVIRGVVSLKWKNLLQLQKLVLLYVRKSGSFADLRLNLIWLFFLFPLFSLWTRGV